MGQNEEGNCSIYLFPLFSGTNRPYLLPSLCVKQNKFTSILANLLICISRPFTTLSNFIRKLGLAREGGVCFPCLALVSSRQELRICSRTLFTEHVDFNTFSILWESLTTLHFSHCSILPNWATGEGDSVSHSGDTVACGKVLENLRGSGRKEQSHKGDWGRVWLSEQQI